MDLALLVYGISTLQGVKAILGGLVALSFAICLALFIYMGDQYGEDNKNKTWAWKRIKMWFAAGLVSVFFFALLPTQKTAYTMVGAYAAQKVAENEKVQQLSGKVLKIIEQKLDNYIDEGFEEAKQKVEKK